MVPTINQDLDIYYR